MKLKPSSYFLIMVMVVSLAIALGTTSFRYQSVKTLPMVISGLIFVLAAISLIKEIRSKKETRGSEEETPLSAYWQTGVWIGVLALGIYLIGFLISIPLFITLYLKRKGSGWLKSIIIAGVTTAFIYGAFEYALRVHLYRGLLFSWW